MARFVVILMLKMLPKRLVKSAKDFQVYLQFNKGPRKTIKNRTAGIILVFSLVKHKVAKCLLRLIRRFATFVEKAQRGKERLLKIALS